MSTQDSKQPDPIGDMVESDIDKLLEQAGRLAQDAGRELGLVRKEGTPPEEDLPKEPPTASSSESPASEPGSAEDIDAQLNELEAMLHKATDSVSIEASSHQTPAAAPPPAETEPLPVPTDASEIAAVPAETSPASEETSHREGQELGVSQSAEAPPPEFDEFNVSVDLSDGEKEAEKEISERLAAPVATADSETAASVSRAPDGLPSRAIAAFLGGVEGVFSVLDIPFSGLPTGLKDLLGYVAIATMIMAIAAYLYGQFALGL